MGKTSIEKDDMSIRIINATFEGVDFWSRVIIKTEGGTRLCDVACNNPEAIKANPDVGDWHTMTGYEDEPCSRIRGDVRFRLICADPAPNDAPANSRKSRNHDIQD